MTRRTWSNGWPMVNHDPDPSDLLFHLQRELQLTREKLAETDGLLRAVQTEQASQRERTDGIRVAVEIIVGKLNGENGLMARHATLTQRVVAIEAEMPDLRKGKHAGLNALRATLEIEVLREEIEAHIREAVAVRKDVGDLAKWRNEQIAAKEGRHTARELEWWRTRLAFQILAAGVVLSVIGWLIAQLLKAWRLG